MLSQRAFLAAVLVAFVAGILLSLGIRPPGGSTPAVDGAGSNGTAAKRIHWRVPLASARNLPGNGETPVWLSEAVLNASGGAIELELFDPGEIMPAFAITEAVSLRKVSAGYTWLGYEQGKIPSSALFAATPFGLEPWAYIAWWYFDEGQTLAEAVYAKHNIKPILCSLSGPETAGWFRDPIESADDLQGMTIRFAGLGGKVLQRVGASITMLPSGELFQALETGVIDATEFSQPITDQALGFARIAKYNYFPGWHQPYSASHLIINLDVWNATAPADQALIESICTGAVTRALGLTEALQGPVIEGFEEQGVTASVLPPDLIDALREAANEVLDEEAARDEDFARALASMRAFKKTYAHWRRLAYPGEPL